MLIKDKDITLYQLLSIKQDRVLYIKVLVSLTSRIWNLFIYLFIYLFFRKNGLVGRWEKIATGDITQRNLQHVYRHRNIS